MLRAPLDAPLSLSAVELSQPRSFSHAREQRTVLYLGAWPGAALSFSHVRAQHTVLDLGAWPGAQARRLRGPRDSCVAGCSTNVYALLTVSEVYAKNKT